MSERPAVAVVGGGIAGLAGALALADAGARVVLLESEARLGGKIRTEEFLGQVVEAGPDAFLARVPDAVALCRRLGLADELVSPATGSASVWVTGRLRKLPEGLVLGVPTRWGPLAASGILSPAGLARATLDLVLPATKRAEDCSVAELVGARLGAQVADRLVGPLVGGINAGVASSLSAKSAAPILDAAARGSRSLVLGLRARSHARSVSDSGPIATRITNTSEPSPRQPSPRQPSPRQPSPRQPSPRQPSPRQPSPHQPSPRQPSPRQPSPRQPSPRQDGPVFLAPRSGLSTLVDVLSAELSEHVELRTGTPVTAMHRVDAGRWELATPTGPLHADGVLLAVPAFGAGSLLGPSAPGAADLLKKIHYASVALVTLAYPESAIPDQLEGSGYLVPAGKEGRMTTACTFTSRKWAHTRGASPPSTPQTQHTGGASPPSTPQTRPRPGEWTGNSTPHQAIFRISVGRWGDARHEVLDDAELVAVVARELAEAIGARGQPVASKVSRWPAAFPQYEVGHSERVGRIEAEVKALGGLALAGAAYRGIGIPACIASGQRAAENLLSQLGSAGEY